MRWALRLHPPRSAHNLEVFFGFSQSSTLGWAAPLVYRHPDGLLPVTKINSSRSCPIKTSLREGKKGKTRKKKHCHKWVNTEPSSGTCFCGMGGLKWVAYLSLTSSTNVLRIQEQNKIKWNKRSFTLFSVFVRCLLYFFLSYYLIHVHYNKDKARRWPSSGQQQYCP